MELKGKNIVITGGTSGIGYQMVKRLQADNTLIVVASDKSRLDRLGKDFEGIQTCQADLAQPAAVRSISEMVKAHFDQLDVLINNAAIQYTPAFLDADFDYASIEREIAINFTAVCCLTSRLLPSLIGSGPAAIVNVNSGLALAPKTSSAVYCATKGALNLFSQSLGYQLADTNVAVLQAFLPLVDTAMTEGRGNGKISAPEAAERILEGIMRDIKAHDIGKVRVLRALLTVAPWLARNIMRRG